MNTIVTVDPGYGKNQGTSSHVIDLIITEYPGFNLYPLLLTWFNFNPSMDK